MFLMETKLKVNEMQSVKTELEFPSMLVVPNVKRSGGLALLWKNEVVVSTQTYSLNHIDVHISSPSQILWRLTRVYGHPEERLKCETSCLIRHSGVGHHSLGCVSVTSMKSLALMRGMAEYPNRYGPCMISRPHFFTAR